MSFLFLNVDKSVSVRYIEYKFIERIFNEHELHEESTRTVQEMETNMEKIVIIGGGIAGLSAGIYARLSGFDVEIYEKNPIPGGECMGWNRDGYHIDNCIHWLTGTRKDTDLYEAWKKVGALSDDTEYVTVDSFFTAVHEGQKITLWADLERTKREMLELSPEDADEIEKFIQFTEYSRQCQLPLRKPMEMYTVKDYIEMGKKMADFPKVMKEFGKISLEDYSKHFKHPLLQKMLCDYLPRQYSAYSFFVSYATIVDGNGNIPMGASLQMSLRIEKRFKELGGRIYYNENVDSIVIDESSKSRKASGIKLADGKIIEAEYIIPAVDTHFLFNKLLPDTYMPKILKTAYDNPEFYPVNSGFQVAYNVPVSDSVSGTLFMDIEPITVGSTTYSRMYVKNYNYDPIFIKDGRCVLQAGISQNDNDFACWESLTDEEYRQKKEEITGLITAQLNKLFPQYNGDIQHLDTWTMLTYVRYCNAYRGSYMSFTTTPKGKQVILNGKIKGLHNVFIAGQWTYSPGGLPVAVASGKFAVQRILKSLGRDIDI